MQEKGLKIVGVSSNYQTAYDKLIQNHPEYILVDPQILSQQEFKALEQAAKQHQATIIVFSKNNEYPLAAIAGYIKKPEKLSKNTFSVDQILHAVNGETEMVPVSIHRSANTPTAPDTPAPKTDKIEVMLIDDSALMKIVISNVLKSDDSMRLICSAENGKVGLEKLKEFQPDVILLDLEMPVMDGESFLREARSKTDAKIIVVSSIASSRADQLKALGADAHIDKPDGSVSMDFAIQSGQSLLNLIHSLIKA